VKTKVMAMEVNLSEEDVAPAQIEEGDIEMVEQFVYLGSTLPMECEVSHCQGLKNIWLSERVSGQCSAIPSCHCPLTELCTGQLFCLCC